MAMNPHIAGSMMKYEKQREDEQKDWERREQRR